MTGPQKLACVYYCKIFIPIESKLAILTNERKYKRLENILKELIYILDDNQFNSEKLSVLLSYIYDYQQEYYKKLCELKEPSSEQKEKYTSLCRESLETRIKIFFDLLVELDKTNSDLITNIESNKPQNAIDLSFNNEYLKTVFESYYNAYKIYESFIEKFEKDETNVLHSANSFINEFHQFFSHYSYAMFIIGYEKDEYNYFVNNNHDRAIKHLERATLDIYKVIVLLLVRNNKLKDKYKLLEVRQHELDNISNNIHSKVDEYQSLIKNEEIFKELIEKR